MRVPAKMTLRAAALLGGTGVALGAFAAHGLRARLAPERLATFETGARWLGALTPLGGVAFIACWAVLLAATRRHP